MCEAADGISGIQSSNGKACCVAECGVCGGSGCSTVAATLGLGADDCCATEIVDSGKACSETNEAPCSIGTDGGKTNRSHDRPLYGYGTVPATRELCNDAYVRLDTPLVDFLAGLCR